VPVSGEIGMVKPNEIFVQLAKPAKVTTHGCSRWCWLGGEPRPPDSNSAHQTCNSAYQVLKDNWCFRVLRNPRTCSTRLASAPYLLWPEPAQAAHVLRRATRGPGTGARNSHRLKRPYQSWCKALDLAALLQQCRVCPAAAGHGVAGWARQTTLPQARWAKGCAKRCGDAGL
jgi:hypothetical protein